jgi:hypothetical protein
VSIVYVIQYATGSAELLFLADLNVQHHAIATTSNPIHARRFVCAEDARHEMLLLGLPSSASVRRRKDCPLMINIRLAIRDGGHVVDVQIPPFLALPEVIVWGERFFSFHHEITTPDENARAEYREVFVYWIPGIQAAAEK